MEGRRSRCDSNGGVGAPEPRNAVINGRLAIFLPVWENISCSGQGATGGKNENGKVFLHKPLSDREIAVQNEKN